MLCVFVCCSMHSTQAKVSDRSAVISAAGTSSFQSLATPAIPDPIGTLLNQQTNYANIISSAHPDPVPNNIVNQLIENPLGPQLDAAFKALPSLQARPPS